MCMNNLRDRNASVTCKKTESSFCHTSHHTWLCTGQSPPPGSLGFQFAHISVCSTETLREGPDTASTSPCPYSVPLTTPPSHFSLNKRLKEVFVHKYKKRKSQKQRGKCLQLKLQYCFALLRLTESTICCAICRYCYLPSSKRQAMFQSIGKNICNIR